MLTIVRTIGVTLTAEEWEEKEAEEDETDESCVAAISNM